MKKGNRFNLSLLLLTTLALAMPLSSFADTATRITFDGGSYDNNPAWSPGGSTLAYDNNVGGDYEILTVPATGGVGIPITLDPAHDIFPDYSPDGTQIAFASDRSGDWSIWVMPAAGGPATRLTIDSLDQKMPSWSPDGTKIAFSGDIASYTGNDIWVIPATGGTAFQVTDDVGSDKQSAWSPDGNQIAFSSNRTGDISIWVIGAPVHTAVAGPPGSRQETSWSGVKSLFR